MGIPKYWSSTRNTKNFTKYQITPPVPPGFEMQSTGLALDNTVGLIIDSLIAKIDTAE